MELFVQAGLTRAEALQTATVNAPKCLGPEYEMGTVEEGKVADLVLLEANPLEDIRNTQRIEAVILDGRFLDRERLDEMLEEVEEYAGAANGPSPAASSEGRKPTFVVENGWMIVGDGTVLGQGSVVVAGDRIVSVTEEPVEAPKNCLILLGCYMLVYRRRPVYAPVVGTCLPHSGINLCSWN